MSDISKILSRLEKVQPKGQGKWMACCSGHEDRSPSLSLKATDDDRILIHCFAGCSVQEIIEPLGLTLADLMPDNPVYKKGSKPPKFNKYELFDRIAEESTILLIAIQQLQTGTPLNEADMKRVLQAESTIDDIAREVRR